MESTGGLAGEVRLLLDRLSCRSLAVGVIGTAVALASHAGLAALIEAVEAVASRSTLIGWP